MSFFTPTSLVQLFTTTASVGTYALFVVVSHTDLWSQEPPVTPTIITTDTVLEPGRDYGPLVIKASGITIDGQGCSIVGSESTPNKRTGIAIEATGVKGVTLKNVRVHNWEIGLKLTDCSAWVIEDCDFSDNFHDPDFGWGENGRRGGIVLQRTHHTTLRRNQAHRVWDACVLVDSHDNTLQDNNFSHTSNTCLKLWKASRNTVSHNNLSYGIRKQPDEVHARDSTGVLIESGSNDNRFLNNDCTYGGDGIFIRVLNRWCSTGNYFEGNDCSYANNNGFECWAPRNVFVSNLANHCSYGFWLGGSDQTILERNEASHNGLATGNHNSPHLPQDGHAGIVFMFGPSSHIIAHGNRCEHNNGAGIALIGDIDSKGEKWKAYHWLIANNQLRDNRWGIFARHADWIRLENNYLADNSQADIESSQGVTRLSNVDPRSEPLKSAVNRPPNLRIAARAHTTVGESVHFAVEQLLSPTATIEWDFGDHLHLTGTDAKCTFPFAGFYRIGVIAREEGTPSQIGWLDFYVTDAKDELATDPAEWSIEKAAGLACSYQRDLQFHIAGPESIAARIDPYHGQLAWLTANLAADKQLRSTSGKSRIVFWIKSINPNLPGWQSNNPEVILTGDNGQQLKLKPKRDLFSQPAYNEARDGWQMIVVPLTTSSEWEHAGTLPEHISRLSIGVDSWDAGPLQLWIDGVVMR